MSEDEDFDALVREDSCDETAKENVIYFILF
jgi:hypothetical protein